MSFQKIKERTSEPKKCDINKSTLLFYLLVSIIYYFPILFRSTLPHFPPQDTYFHLNRILSLDSVFVSPISFSAFGHHGTMVNMCYPWLTIYPAWLIFRITHRLLISYKTYQIFLTFLTLCSAHYVMQSIAKCRSTSQIFSMIYTFSLYRFANVFRRQALGEIIAMVFLPIIILGLYNIIISENKRWFTLAIGMTGLMYTHFLSAFLSFFVIIIVFLINLPFMNSIFIRLKALIKSGVIAFLLSLASVISLITSAPDLFFPKGNTETLTASAFPISQRIIMSLTNQPVSYSLGLTILLAIPTTVFLIIYSLIKNKMIQNKNKFVFAGSIFITGLLTTLISTSVFPWRIVTGNPFLAIQFAWRLNALSTVMISFSLCFFFKKCAYCKPLSHHIMLPILCIGLLTIHYHCLYNLRIVEHNSITEEAIVTGNHYHIDYTPVKAVGSIGWDWSNYYLNINGSQIAAETILRKSYYIVYFENPFPGESVMEVPVFWFPHLTVTIDGKPLRASCSDNGLVLLTIPSGYHTVNLHYSYSISVRCSQFISLLTVIILFGQYYRKKITGYS